MKKAIAAAAFVVIGSATAFAADLPVRAYEKAPMLQPAPAYNWTGFYVGVNAGGGLGRTNIDDPDSFWSSSNHITGGLGVVGGQAGYNWQWRAVVLGIEGDYDYSSFKEPFSFNTFNGLNSRCTPSVGSRFCGFGNIKVDAIASVRGRMGLAYENALFYVTAGPAWGKTNFSETAFAGGIITNTFSDDTWRVGIAAGVGLEWKLNSNWSLRGEWLHVELKQKFIDSVPSAGRMGTAPSFDIARLGVNYFFTGY